MSDYSRYVVVRYPITKAQAVELEDLLMNNPLGKHLKNGYFEITGAYSDDCEYVYFLDYVVKHTYGDESGEYGKIRSLKHVEVDGFKPIFEMLIPNLIVSQLKIVDYCYYNCSEPPAYYSEKDDPFYRPLCPPSAVWIEDTSKTLVTPGGDPWVICSRCNGGGHVDGIECPNFIKICPSCGAIMSNGDGT